MDFNKVINRRKTRCGKWDTLDKVYEGVEDLIHLGVADMDFKTPPEILDDIRSVCNMGVLGYTDLDDEFFKSISLWYKKRHNLDIPTEWIVFCPRINIAAGLCINKLMDNGDEVIINTPAYGPLLKAIEANNKKALRSSLQRVGNTYKLDFEDMTNKVSKKTKMFLACNPHNPTSRVWKKEELEQIGQFCKENDLIIFSDEIHSDLLNEGIKFNSFLSLDETIKDRLIVANSPAKTFNMPGLVISYMIIPNPNLRNKVKEAIDAVGMHNPNIFSVGAVETAYTKCDYWYKEVLDYINNNEKFTRDYFSKNLPEIEILNREGTYLLWMDYRNTGLTEKELRNKLINEAKVEVYMGSNFGVEGEGYIRVNIATSREMLKEAYDRIYSVLKK